MAAEAPRPIEEFRRLAIDLYIAPNHPGYWESAVREADDPFRGVERAVDGREPFTIDLLYGDLYGGQRTISRFFLVPFGDDGWYPQAVRHWHLDGPAPR